jgi:FKBP-type peptidyl-prolyl cis-trans isomerase
MRLRAIACACLLVLACQDKAKKKSGDPTVSVSPQADAGTKRLQPPARPPKVQPPLPVDKPPPDAEELTGVEGAPRAVIRIKRLTPGTGEKPGRNDTVRLNFTGWRLNGETYVTTTVRKRPVTQSLAVLAPGFAVAVTTMQKGERAMMWIPPELGYMGTPTDTPETTVYEVELVDFERGPPTPPDVAGPPAGGGVKTTPSGHKYIVVAPGTGKVKPRQFDVVTLSFSAWSATGRLFDSTEVTKQPRRTFPFHEPIAVDEIVTNMVVGQRVRAWMPADQFSKQPGVPSGQICYEVELTGIEKKVAPPPVPASVAAPPPGAKKTPGGVSYEVLKPGTGKVHPTETDRVQLHFTGWLTNGRMYDSSEIHGQPSGVPTSKLMPGWQEAMQLMVEGARWRLWIPVEKAYNNAAGLPPGMLVIETELLEILPKTAPQAPAAPPAPLKAP